MYASGHDAAGTTLTAQQGTAMLQLPASMLKPGKNLIALRLSYPPAPGDKRPIVIQDIVTEWDQSLVIQDASYTFKPKDLASTGARALKFSEKIPDGYRVLGYANHEPTLLDVQDDSVHVPSGGAFLNYQLTNLETAEPVYSLQQVEKSFHLNELQSAESVIITSPELLEGAAAIMQTQQKRGLNVFLVTTDKLYNMFSYGKSEPSAIRNALRYMFYRAPGVPPEYVTLVGEASDFQGDPRLVPQQVQLNMIASSAAASPEAPQGDHQYAASIGTDQIADFILGRISASNSSQVLDYAAKAKEYEAGDAGEWSRVTEFVMDDNDEFPDVVSRIITSSIAPPAKTSLLRQWDHEYVPNLRVQGKKRSWTATTELIDSFNRGLGILNFFGHGGPNLWSHERMLHLSDLPEIVNELRLPLVTCASCDNAWITYPMPPVKVSMGELLVLKRDGGAIGLFGPVAGASPYEHSTLVQNLMEGIVREQLRKIGDAIFYAKNRYYGITRSASVPEQYLLLGDPTVSLKMPRVEPILSTASSEVRSRDNTTVALRLDKSAKLETTGTLSLKTSAEGELSRIPVLAGQSQWNISLPQEFKGGNVLALLEWQTAEGQRLAGTAVKVLPPLSSASVQEMVKTGSIGTGYDILPVAANTDPDAGTAASYLFQLTATGGTTAPVRVVAYHGNEQVGEVTSIEPAAEGVPKDFKLSTKALLDASSTSNLTLAVNPLDAANSSDAATTVTFAVPAKAVAELEFVQGSERVYAESGELVAGHTIFLEAEILNSGQRISETFTLQALKDNPSTGTELQTINDSTGMRVEQLEPGESRKIRFRWENSAAGSAENIYLVANRNKLVPERNYDNNHLALPAFEVRKPGNFTVTDFEVSPVYASPGTTVTVSGRFENDFMLVDRPVTVEVGWERSFDKTTTASRFPIVFQDGVATFTREIATPEEFTHVYTKVNADLEIEEVDPGDNTTHTENMIIYDMPEFEGSYPLSDSFVWGTAFNLDNPFPGQLQVSADYSSHTGFLIVDHQDVTHGKVSHRDDPNDNAWFVAPWRVVVGNDEAPGEIGFQLPPLDTLVHDVPGNLYGYFLPLPPPQASVEVRLPGFSQWKEPAVFGEVGNRTRLDFGSLKSQNRRLSWEMRKSNENAGFALEYLVFHPKAVQWDSPPYLLPQSLRSRPLLLQISIGDAKKWESIIIDRRSGTANGNGGITWQQWSSAKNSLDVAVFAEEYLQIRLMGVPKDGEHPYIENVRISPQ